jgi:hypothetical protein
LRSGSPTAAAKSAGRNFWAALISDEENREKTPSFSAARVSLLLTGSLLTVLPAAHAADDDNTILGMSLPQVNNSAIGYGKSVDGAVSDKLFYTLGGGSVISQPATRGNMQKLGLNTGWSSDLMCGNFDLKTTVGNQLNGVTSGFKNLMGDVIQGPPARWPVCRRWSFSGPTPVCMTCSQTACFRPMCHSTRRSSTARTWRKR